MSFVTDMFKKPKVPAMPAPEPTPPTPTVDDARQAAESQMEQNKRRGAMANIFSKTDTGAQLGKPSPESSLKRMLGA